MANHYQLLGIEHTHPQHLIPQAFRHKAREVHPDKANSIEEQQRCKEQTVRLIEAYKTLNDPVKRQQYDARIRMEKRQSEISTNRHFHQTSLKQGDQGWEVQCEQCFGTTSVSPQEAQALTAHNSQYFIKCYHCGLALTLQLEE